MKIALPDLSGPPVAWDAAVLLLLAVGIASAVRHRLHTHVKPV